MEQVPRHVAPGGAKRLIIGFAAGLAAGAMVALVLPRDDGPRRRTLVFDDPESWHDREPTRSDARSAAAPDASSGGRAPRRS